MHESKIKKECKLTWALNHGDLNPNTETGAPPRDQEGVKVDRRGRVSMKRPGGMDRETWAGVKAEMLAHKKYLKAMVCHGGDSRRAHYNGARIAKGLEAGAILASLDQLGRAVRLWSYLRYRDVAVDRKSTAFIRLAAILVHDYMAKRSLKEAEAKRIALITLYQLGSILNQYDKKWPAPKLSELGDYKNPRDFKYRHGHVFDEVQRMILTFDKKAKAGA